MNEAFAYMFIRKYNKIIKYKYGCNKYFKIRDEDMERNCFAIQTTYSWRKFRKKHQTISLYTTKKTLFEFKSLH